MQEKYYSLGIETSWTNAAFCILLAIGICAWRSVKAKRFVGNGWDLAAILWNGMVWFLGIPFSIWLPGTFGLMILGSILTMKRKPDASRKRLAFSVFLAVLIPTLMGAFFLKMFGHTIELSESRAKATENGRSQDVARVGLRIDATGHPMWIDNRKTWSWTTFNGDQFGPQWMGQEVFFGPTGIMRGDDLGRRFSEWATVEPKYRTLK